MDELGVVLRKMVKYGYGPVIDLSTFVYDLKILVKWWHLYFFHVEVLLSDFKECVKISTVNASLNQDTWVPNSKVNKIKGMEIIRQA